MSFYNNFIVSLLSQSELSWSGQKFDLFDFSTIKNLVLTAAHQTEK